MITDPLSSRLIEAVRNELRRSIRPAITDRHLLDTLERIDSVLHSLAVRAAHEIAWMHEEMAEIEAIADRVVDTGIDVGGRVTEALSAFRTQRAGGHHLADVQRDYDRASEVLSRALETVVAPDSPLRAEVIAVLESRIRHEDEIRGGPFRMAGRG